ncbi:MAG TPA: Crp/Fnr family transcriptional regulator [Chitinophagaceae bacterium]|nr:Crp/Fnr family transcriptional regulator [Chitinophagaceae bacterium]HNF72303.1 Crp/Fnr family transcriptional regulator [Chitinophagaceae bacterium]
MVNPTLLLSYGASYKTFEKGETIFSEGAQCYYYYQLSEGKVSWLNWSESGKEFIQQVLHPGECFGELPLFDHEPYAASAIASEDSTILRLPKESFLTMLREHPDLHFEFSKMMAGRLRMKFMLLTLLAYECPEKRISTLLQYLKKKMISETMVDDALFPVNFTRQQLANMTGLRVETVIRVIRNLEKKGVVQIDHGKVFL